jgi:hypothetical protein
MAVVFFSAAIASVLFVTRSLATITYDSTTLTTTTTPVKVPVVLATLDTALYNKKMITLANNLPPKVIASSTSTSTISYASYISRLLASTSSTTSVSIPSKLWPVSNVYPNSGALLPFNRIVAYYGNFYSKNMGVLGAYPTDQMLSMLLKEAAKWHAADPATPVIPAIDYIVTTAQGSPGQDGMYRFRMPANQIQIAIDLANQVHGVVFLDVQVGLSTLEAELPPLEPYLKLPNVHLAIDPEFSMKTGAKPGSVIGTFGSADINYAAQFLAGIARQNNLPPKILVVHRFTSHMVTGYSNIKPLPEVQLVMDMDGWGPQAQKLKTYHDYVYAEPVQFAGFKLFYKNDLLPPSTGMLTPEQLLKLTPRPAYIQYQ